jgi:replicative DNA helicase
MKVETYLQNLVNDPRSDYAGYVPPQAVDLENAVLGAIMLEPTAIDEVESIITEESFYNESNRKIFAACKKLSARSQPVDMLTVIEELKTCGDLESIGGPFTIAQKTNNVVSGANVAQHAMIVQQKYLRRKLNRTCDLIKAMTYDEQVDEFDLLEYAEREIMEVGYSVHDSKFQTLTDLVVDAVKKIHQLGIEKKTITGVPCGFHEIDVATRGWQPGDLIILAARPSVGKTAFLLNIVKNAIKAGTNVAFWSLEMDAIQLVMRMLSEQSEVWLSKIQTGKFSPEEFAFIEKSASELTSGKGNIFFEDGNQATISSVRAKARRLKRKKNLGMIVIDYLQLMSGDERSNREQEISKISRGLKNLARELQIPIIALSQLGRDIEKRQKSEPQLSDLRESGAIEQDADLIMFLYNPSDDEINKDSRLARKKYVKIAKHRNGVLLKKLFDFDSPIQRFKESEETGSFASNLKPIGNLVDYSAPKSINDDDDPPF